MIFWGLGGASQKVAAQDVSVNFQVFYDELSPYGTWVEKTDYGYVWIPNVGSGFTPYETNGYWIFTDNGWTWVSNYPWGWAPFHYGRWYDDSTYGPVWVPDNHWGPAWVSWRRSNGYYGWAPLRPGQSRGGGRRDEHWTFVKQEQMGRKDIRSFYVNSSRNGSIYDHSKEINNNRVDKRHNVTYNAGPDRAEVEKRVGKPITPVVVRENPKPGQSVRNNRMNTYRPQLPANNANTPKPAPAKVGRWEDIKAAPPRAVQPARQPVQQTKQQKTRPAAQPRPDNPAQNTRRQAQPQRQAQPVREQPVQPQPGKPVQRVEGDHQRRNNGQPDRQQHAQPRPDNPAQNRNGGDPQPQRNNQPNRQQPPQPQQPHQGNPPGEKHD